MRSCFRRLLSMTSMAAAWRPKRRSGAGLSSRPAPFSDVGHDTDLTEPHSESSFRPLCNARLTGHAGGAAASENNSVFPVPTPTRAAPARSPDWQSRPRRAPPPRRIEPGWCAAAVAAIPSRPPPREIWMPGLIRPRKRGILRRAAGQTQGPFLLALLACTRQYCWHFFYIRYRYRHRRL